MEHPSSRQALSLTITNSSATKIRAMTRAKPKLRHGASAARPRRSDRARPRHCDAESATDRADCLGRQAPVQIGCRRSQGGVSARKSKAKKKGLTPVSSGPDLACQLVQPPPAHHRQQNCCKRDDSIPHLPFLQDPIIAQNGVTGPDDRARCTAAVLSSGVKLQSMF